MRTSIHDLVKSLIVDFNGIDWAYIKDDSKLVEHLDFDPLAFTEIFDALEEQLDCLFSDEEREFAGTMTFAQLVDMVASKTCIART